jgi:hypothetical protein
MASNNGLAWHVWSRRPNVGPYAAVVGDAGIAFVGPRPAALQTTTICATAHSANAKETAAAGALVKFLSSRSVAARQMGLDPLSY